MQRQSHMTRLARKIDNPPTRHTLHTPHLPHPQIHPRKRLAGKHRSEQIDIKVPPDLFRRRFFHFGQRDVAGGVDEDVRGRAVGEVVLDLREG